MGNCKDLGLSIKLKPSRLKAQQQRSARRNCSNIEGSAISTWIVVKFANALLAKCSKIMGEAVTLQSDLSIGNRRNSVFR
jgi:hypothetical protein